MAGCPGSPYYLILWYTPMCDYSIQYLQSFPLSEWSGNGSHVWLPRCKISHWEQCIMGSTWYLLFEAPWVTIQQQGRVPKNTLNSVPQSKNTVCAFQIYANTSFVYLGKFVKELADHQCSSIIEKGIYHIKHLVTRWGKWDKWDTCHILSF